MLLQLSHFPSYSPLPSLPPAFPPFSSCPWVIHISSLVSTFPILFLPSSCLFSTYNLCYLFSVPFPPLFPSLSSCPWVVHKSSMASPFPILFLTSSCLLCTNQLCFLFPVPYPPSFPSTSPLMILHVISISMVLFLF